MDDPRDENDPWYMYEFLDVTDPRDPELPSEGDNSETVEHDWWAQFADI